MSFVLVGLNHWVAKGEVWGDEFHVHRKGCPDAEEGSYGVDWVASCKTIEEAAFAAFGDFIDEDLEEDFDDDYMSVKAAIRHLTICGCTKEGANFCNVSQCVNCGDEVYDLENAIHVEWWTEDDCGCTRGE